MVKANPSHFSRNYCFQGKLHPILRLSHPLTYYRLPAPRLIESQTWSLQLISRKQTYKVYYKKVRGLQG